MLVVANPKRFKRFRAAALLAAFVLTLGVVGHLGDAERPARATMGHTLRDEHVVDGRFAGLIVGKKPSKDGRGIALKVRTHDGFTIDAHIGADVLLPGPLKVGHRVELIGTSFGPGRVSITRRDAVTLAPTLDESNIVGPVKVRAGVAYVPQGGQWLTLRVRLEDGTYDRMELTWDADGRAWLEPA